MYNNRRIVLAVPLLALLIIAPGFAGTQIAPSAFKVESRSSRWFPFRVTGRSSEVKGRFQSRGGSDNRIRCLIVDQENLDKLINGQPASGFYDSGSVVVANISVKLSQGDYFLLFDNREGWLTSRDVWANIQLEY